MPASLLLLRRRFWCFVCVWMCVAAMLPLAGRAQTWREVRSPNFRVVTDGSEQSGRAVAREFEQMRGVFADRFRKATLETGAPLTIFAVHEGGLKQLGPGFYKDRDKIGGEFFPGWERQFAMVRLDVLSEQNQAIVFHEYTHSVLHANNQWLPTWLDEGMAEFYGYTRFQKDAIYIGAPSIRYEHLMSKPPIPIETMLTFNGSFGKDEDKNDLFYAEAWAMVHYMTFGKNMEGGIKLNRFLALLENGSPQMEAFRQVFGEPKEFGIQLSSYLARLTLTASLMPPNKGLDAKTFGARVLTLAETDAEIGAFDIHTGDVASGRSRIAAALAANPGLGSAHEELAFLDWREGKDDDAKAEWQRAVTLDPALYRSGFALLMTGTPLRAQGAPQLTATEAALQKLVQTAPKFPPAYVELALVKWRQGRMNDAYKDAVTAQKLAPWRAGYRLLIGYILAQGHQPEIAATYARTVATRWPGSDHDEAVDLWTLLPTGSRGDGPPLTFSLAGEPSMVRGTVVATACEKSGFTVTLQPEEEKAPVLKLVSAGRFESGFSDTLWMGRDHYTICHHLGGLPAMVAYKPEGGSGGKLIAFEVRDDLPKFHPEHAAPKADAAPAKSAAVTTP